MAEFKEIKLKLNKRNPEITNDIPLIKADQIPTLISPEKLNILTEGDDDPFFFAQAIKFPIEANDDIYEVEFAESFVERNKLNAFPGDKYGHDVKWYKRQPTHFYQIGGMVQNGIAYFKFYVPPQTDSESNDSFIKEIKINGIDLSLVSRVKYVYNEDDEKYHILASAGGERNDAVGYGDGSMDQIVINKNKNDKEEGLEMDEILKKLNALIVSGELSIPDLMKKLNKSDKLKTDEDVASLKVLNSLKAELGDDPLAKAKELKTTVKANAEAVRDAELTTAFGPKLNADKSENLKRTQAESLLVGKDVNEDSIAEVRKNALFLAVAGKEADVNSEANTVLNVDQGGTEALNSSAMEL